MHYKAITCFFLLLVHITPLQAQVDLRNGLLACYPFTANANDASGNGSNGTIHGATLTTDRFGNANSAYRFNGAGEYISIPPDQLKLTQFSYSLWVNAHSIPTSGTSYFIFSVGSEYGDQSIGLNQVYSGPNSGWTGGGYSAVGENQFYATGVLPSTNTWTHLVVTRNSSLLKLYVGGQLVGSVSVSGKTPFYGIGTVAANIGGRSVFTQYFDGDVDDIHIYNRAISAAEVTELYNAPNLQGLSVQASNLTPCMGNEVTFTATPAPGGDTQYQWKVNGVNQGGLSNSPSFAYTFANNSSSYPATVSVEATSKASCVSAVGQTTVTVHPPITPNVSISADNLSPCTGSPVKFTAVTNLTGAMYQWKVGGINQGTPVSSATFTHTFTSVQPSTVSVEVTSSQPCTNPATANFPVSVLLAGGPVVTLSASDSTTCADASVKFTAVTNVTGVTYQWKIDGISQTASDNVLAYSFANKPAAYIATVSVEATSPAYCTSTKKQTTITINPKIVPSITVLADNATPCAETPVKFTATSNVANGLYQWKIDGVSQGAPTTSTAFSTNFAESGQSYNSTISVEVTSSAPCTFPAKATAQTAVKVNTRLVPTASIQVSELFTCTGSPVKFTAVTNLTGAMYQWKVGGINQGTPTDSPTFIYTFANPLNYTVAVEVMPNSACSLPALAQINMAVNPPSTFAVSLTASNQAFCGGKEVTFAVTPDVPGTAYQWKVDGKNQGALTSTSAFSYIFPGKVQQYQAVVGVEVFPNQPCTASAVRETTLTVYPTPVTTCVFPDTVEVDSRVIYRVITVGGQPPYTYTWVFEHDTIPGLQRDTISYAYTGKGDYEANVIVTDQVGCQTICAATQHVVRPLFFPNVFTPNGDTHNDTFTIQYEGKDFEMSIYNRWGKLVVKTTDGLYRWDGEGCPTGLYYYQITCASKEYKGWLSLLR